MSSLMRLIPASERPRERCLEKGAASLSLRECLAVLIGTGNAGGGCLEAASTILERFGPGMPEPELQRALFTALEGSPESCFVSVGGLNRAGRARLLAAFELARRYSMLKMAAARNAPRGQRYLDMYVREATARVPLEFRTCPKEWLAFVPVFATGEVGEFCVVERGTRTHVNFDPAELFARVLALRPRGFFLFHNHPSGNPHPSTEDLDLTRRVRRAATELGTRLYGHKIITPSGEGWAESDLS